MPTNCGTPGKGRQTMKHIVGGMVAGRSLALAGSALAHPPSTQAITSVIDTSSFPSTGHAKRTGSSEGVSCDCQGSHVRERGGFGLDGADQVVQRSFGCHPERGGDESRVKAVCELRQTRVAQQARADASGVGHV